jgi:hypothetical protein
MIVFNKGVFRRADSRITTPLHTDHIKLAGCPRVY